MKIYLDFKGTIVEHECWRENFGCMEVIEKLQKAGHEIVLNTSYAFEADKLKSALSYVNDHRKVELTPIKALNTKASPARWDWDGMLEYEIMFIDDHALDIPLKKCVMGWGEMVNWEELDKQFKEKGIYEKSDLNDR